MSEYEVTNIYTVVLGWGWPFYWRGVVYFCVGSVHNLRWGNRVSFEEWLEFKKTLRCKFYVKMTFLFKDSSCVLTPSYVLFGPPTFSFLFVHNRSNTTLVSGSWVPTLVNCPRPPFVWQSRWHHGDLPRPHFITDYRHDLYDYKTLITPVPSSNVSLSPLLTYFALLIIYTYHVSVHLTIMFSFHRPSMSLRQRTLWSLVGFLSP